MSQPILARRSLAALLLAAPGIARAQAPAGRPITLGVSLASDTNPFYVAMRRGIQAHAEALGWRTVFVTANEVVSAQVNGLSDLAAQRVSGILCSPIDATAVAAGYEAAGRAGIPVISVARHATSPHQTAFLSMDEVQVGRDIGAWIVRTTGGQGKVGLIMGPPGAATFRNINAGLEEALRAAPGLRVVYRQEGPLTREFGLKQAEDLLTAHPDVRAIYAANDEVALGASQAVTAAGRAGAVAITGMNGIPPALRAVRTGTLGMTVELNPAIWGGLGVDAMAALLLRGERPDSTIKAPHRIIDRENVPPA